MAKIKTVESKNQDNNNANINPDIEHKFKILLKIMSWIVGVCFILVIILPLIESNFIDLLVKILFFIAVINLLLFAVFEFFGQNIKQLLSKNKV